ncbi:hypothetical protein [Niastella yeongjuensis]|nr:hypothetical protein [Niastella yeongjuensis]SEP48188.1 hypothetical protein SAMN05660816_06707 [Niastella yeongjuensis]
MAVDRIRKDIESIKENETKLYSYLYDLTYQEKTNNVRLLETIYSEFLNDKRSEIKRVALYCLLFGLKIKKPEYRQAALITLTDKASDFDLRLTCVSGLAQAYFATDDKGLLGTLFTIFNDQEEDEDIRTEAFTGMMGIHGINSVELLSKNSNKIVMSMDDIKLENFEQEIKEIKVLLL